MQTFLPYSDYQQSAKCLDMKRLGKQRVEVLQLLNSFYRPDYKGWKNHPAREMWRGYENALVRYGQFICLEWTSRGYKDTCYQKISNHFDVSKHTQDPPWIGREDIHISHKSNLIRKMPGYYKPLWPEVPDDIPYVWQLIKYGMEIVAALKLPDGTIFIGRFSHAKAMYALLKDIPNPSQELLDNIVEGFIDMKTNKFYTRDEFKVIHSSYSYNLTSQNIV